MKSEKYAFTFADILGRRGDFRRDIREVGRAKGEILSCGPLGLNDDSCYTARLWMSDFTGKRHSIVTLAAFFDPRFGSDAIIVPEFKMSFYYQWGDSDFCTEKVMSIMDELGCAKISDTTLCEWELLRVAAAVCAVYEFMGRLHFGGHGPGAVREFVAGIFGDGPKHIF